MISANVNYIFEVSWEVCNKIGGIYTVLSTRAKTLQQEYPDRIIFIGPDFEGNSNQSYFEEDLSIGKKLKLNSIAKNLSVRAGRWKIPGSPIALLVRFDAYGQNKEAVYSDMWRIYGVDSLHSYGDYEEATLFSMACADLISGIYDQLPKSKKSRVVAHFNEWTTGMGALLLQQSSPEIATVFTTHATSIGRSIAGNQKPLYDYLSGYDGDQMARELNMESKHSLEKQTAHYVDCFTTVSEITNNECRQLLGKEAYVTPNGFELDFVPAPRVFSKNRKEVRSYVARLYNALTGKQISADALLVATSGRYEYRNKGIDLFVDSLHRLSQSDRLKKREVCGIVLVPAWVKEPRQDLLDRLSLPEQIFETPLESPIITHHLNFQEEDNVINQTNYLQLKNSAGSTVDLLFIPIYLNGLDPIVPYDYYHFLQGVDMTVFPSYYEPWGYTPLESIAFGIPTVTTSLSGFGAWASEEIDVHTLKSGVKVINRNDHNATDVSVEIMQTILDYLDCSQSQRSRISKGAKELALKADWQSFIQYYYNVYTKAIEQSLVRLNKI